MMDEWRSVCSLIIWGMKQEHTITIVGYEVDRWGGMLRQGC